MEDQTQKNWGAPPATDTSGIGDPAAPQPLMPPAPHQPAPQPDPPDTAQTVASGSGPSSWPSIPDTLPDSGPVIGQSAGGDMPTLPASPATPATPIPGMPGALFPPTYPAAPSAPPQPGIAGMPPSYPSSPSMPLQGYPGSPSQPAYSGFPPPTPTQPGGWGAPFPPTYPAYPGSPSLPFTPSIPLQSSAWGQAPRRSPSALAQPFPFWLSLLLVVGALLLAAAVYITDEVVVHGDWADGARAASVTALILAGAALVVLFLRIALGRRATSTLALGLVLVVLLAGLGAGGVAFASPLHGLQAQSLERGGDWSGAIYEYELTGESTPNAPDIARVYDEWGEHDFQQKSYKSAVAQFTTVITQYGQSGVPVQRAQTDLFSTFVAWVQANDPTVPYSSAISDFVAYRANPQCDTTCQTTSQAAEAQARYQYGLQLLAQRQYSAAIQQFELVQSQFATSSYAKPAHSAAAQAYLALGQQQFQSSCSSAIPTYQTLAKHYGDTPEGAKAKAALAAPQSVTGNISSFTDPTRTVYLSRSVNLGAYYFSDDYRTGVDGHGSFTFRNVKQGKYNLSAASYVSGNYIIYPYWSVGQNLYSVQVGPLCPTDIGQLSFS